MRACDLAWPLVLILAGMTGLCRADDDPASDGWKSLFNGRDLGGWVAVGNAPETWKAEDSLLVCTGEGSGWLSTTEEYSDFELELEFRLPPGGNSGVFLRTPREGNPAYVGLEVQVLDDGHESYKDLRPEQYTGSVYDVVAAKPRVGKAAGQWQTMAIRCEGPKIRVTFNGTVVVDAKLDAYPEKEATHSGLKRQGGYLGLQNHDSRVEYRNLRIRKLP